jgi:ornithine cyclodeaminase/alanine dehydrogenase-like protein (mu-crystallin family)
MIVISREEVAKHLSYEVCIPLMREAMIALARGETRQLLRSILDLADGHMFGVMPGALGATDAFGAKIISVFPENFSKGLQSHQGFVAMFDAESGAPSALLHAGEITRIRTAAASAAATDALAHSDASELAILGYGEQAHAHAEAIAHVRSLRGIRIWGRDISKAQALATHLSAQLGVPARAANDVAGAVDGADIICTTTASAQPILQSDWVGDGAHINAVGSSRAGPSEIASDLVVRARFFADYAIGVRAQGAEFLIAKAAGLVGDEHVLGDIGAIYDGTLAGRTSAKDVTLYKSLGHIVQDLASARWLVTQAPVAGFGVRVAF